MQRSVRRTFNRRRPRAQLQWTEAKAARDAAVAMARRAPLVVGPNIAQRGLVLNQGEFKCVDVLCGGAVDTTTAVDLVNGIARGDELDQRIGRELTMRSVQIDMVTKATAGTGIAQQHRILLVYDRQTNATALTAVQVLTGATVYSPRNLENRRRFKILMDKKFQLNASGESGSERMFKFYRRLAHPVTFNSGDAGTVADITTGSLYLIYIGSIAAGATAGSIVGHCRIRYSDN